MANPNVYNVAKELVINRPSWYNPTPVNWLKENSFLKANNWSSSLLKSWNFDNLDLAKSSFTSLSKTLRLRSDLLNKFADINGSLKTHAASSQATLLCRATSNLTSSLILETIKQKTSQNVELLNNYFDGISEISGKIEEEGQVSNQILQYFVHFVDEIKNQISTLKLDPKFVGYFLHCLTVLGFLIAIYSLNLQTSDASNNESIEVMNEKLQQAKMEILNHVDSLVTDHSVREVPLRISLRLKPNKHSQILSTCQKGEQVSVIDSFHKWYLIILRRDEELPITGWVLKKSLNR